jgi:hypothetical protein
MGFFSGQGLYLALGAAVLLVLLRRSSGEMSLGPVLVLRRFKVEDRPRDGKYVEIIGRPEGLLGWLLTAVGLDSEMTLLVTGSDVSVEESGLKGKVRRIVPVSNIASASVGYTKSILLLYIGSAFVVGGLLGGLSSNSAYAMVLGILVGGALLAGYWFSNRLQLAVETNGGSYVGLRFKRSLIENVSVDFDKAAAVVALLQQLMLESQARRDVSETPQRTASPRAGSTGPIGTSPGQPAGPVRAPAATPAPTAICPKCSAKVEPNSTFCESCGTRVSA